MILPDDTEATGYTFNMNFIGMRSALWSSCLLPSETPEQLVDLHMGKMDLGENSAWGYDQLIISRILLERRLCWVKPNNDLWSLVKLDPVQEQYDQRYIYCSDENLLRRR